MADLMLRPMTSSDYETLRASLIKGYAAEQVRAGNWNEHDSERLASEEIRQLLPQGISTPGMLILTAATLDDEKIGHVWIALEPRGNATGEAWIYDIEVLDAQRGKGYGRLLLEAAEYEALSHGSTSIGLNVFGANSIARRLYETSGYEIKAMQMRKSFTPTGK